jgi:molybdopterin converting factor small subunit
MTKLEFLMATGTVRYWAAAKDAAGVAEEPFEASTLGDLVTKITKNPQLEQVLRRSAFLVNGTPAGTRDPHTVDLPEGAVVEVLPPFAGG